ncbi:tRNA pseudouridine(38-40) synthase TruA [Nitratifractor salsuginis]|uniref:tRNA pseudouridine synthase A n=1 Tax=Nitratifractor salsuginis (strain DSM 16511 / JCM 12458 / E9I37-1) TaxID=749222 RepID=E6X2S5_NITSE|nr:tRNA pseudouridine(38-40) synthase TruA [Nitratifractor salsuginis]ADV46141.1 tRNA pseudouridine synthase A [Nitratifractor salsuginis DSM 16511]
MQRIKAVIAYDGSAFEGFQRQKRTPRTVQGALERALASLGIGTPIVGSGRTDAGVHATGQVIHFDLPPHWAKQPLDELQIHLNRRLDAIRFKHLTPVPADFHARYDAKERIYRYIFRREPSIFERKYVAGLAIADEAKLSEALKTFQGRHDFSHFLKTGSETAHNIRTITRAYFLRRGKYGYIYFHADGFLRAQVRMMVHAAAAVANGELSLEQLKEQLELGKRYTTRLAPPEGLYLARVIY